MHGQLLANPGPGFPAMSRPHLLSVNIPRRSDLEKSYMAWLKRGGLFVPTGEPYRLGDAIYLLLSLPGQTERISVDGEVVWIVPPTNSRKAPPGIGVQFSDTEASRSLRTQIEALLADGAN
jgi:type IV pilus assembly protein PilZ